MNWNENDSLKSFFGFLASRYSDENDLSNVTWALCQSSGWFMETWMRFFFPFFDTGRITGFYREMADDEGKGSRADFVITVEGESKPYVIEVKIWDDGHHFEQYLEAYRIGKERLGYIVNYPLSYKDFKVRSWSEFFDHLKDSSIPEQDKEVVHAYCEYLKRVCVIMRAENKIDIEKTASLQDLILLFGDLVNRETESYRTIGFDTPKWESTLTARRAYLELSYKSGPWSNTKLWPCFGLWFDNQNPRICAEFEKEKGWGKPVFDFLKANVELFGEMEVKYTSLPRISPKVGAIFDFSEYALDAFNKAETVDEQREIMKRFLDEVLLFPLRLSEALDKE